VTAWDVCAGAVSTKDGVRGRKERAIPHGREGLFMAGKTAIIPVERIMRSILLIRGEKIILDSDIAALYGVETKMLVRAMKRNLERFPPDFMFQLSQDEFENLRSQFGTSSLWGGRRYAPYAFTEQGVAMLSSVLKSKRAVRVNIEIMRTFVRLREILSTHKNLARKIEEMERTYDGQFRVVFEALRAMMGPPKREKKPIGFHTERSALTPRNRAGRAVPLGSF